MKILLTLLIIFGIIFVCGCNVDDFQEGVSEVTPTCFITSTEIPTPTIVTTVTATITSNVDNQVTESTTLSQTPQICIIFGYITNVEGTKVAINEVELIYHKAEENDGRGEEYQSDWMEIFDTGKKYILYTSDESNHLFADLFNNGNNEDILELQSISNDVFLSVCTKEYFGAKLYFKISFVGNMILNTEFLMDYYLNG